jgi:hypothetical protein
MNVIDIVRIARDLIQARMENGYPFEEHETAETVALEMREQNNPFRGATYSDMIAGVHAALKAEGRRLPRR